MNDPRPEWIQRLEVRGWKPGPTIAETQIDTAEIELGVTFPAGYRRFLAALGASTPQERWRGLWHADELVSLNRSLPLFQWFGGLIGIGNEGFLVYALDYRNGSDPPVVSVGLSSSDWEDVIREADTFDQWLETL